jgi:phosphoribosylanthranilate isomerase
MNKMLIKICGITEKDILEYMIEHQVDLAGFIFYPKSPRYIKPEKVKQILMNPEIDRKRIKTVGVFVNEDIQKVKEIANELSLDYIQLHGQEKPEYIEKLNTYNIIKAFRIKDDFTVEEINKYKLNNVKYFLTDTFEKGIMGGTGKAFHWDQFQFLKDIPNLIISGGLNKQNILEAIKLFQPAGIDINSGVESSPGIKNTKKINDILRIIREG